MTVAEPRAGAGPAPVRTSSTRSPLDGARTSRPSCGPSGRDGRAGRATAPSRDPSSSRFAAPGLHLIAEVKRSSPSAGRIADQATGHRRAGPGLRGRRRCGDLGALRAALVRRLGRRPAAGPRRRQHPGPGQGIRRRSAPARDRCARPVPTPCCCWSSCTRASGASRAGRRGPRARAWSRWSRPTTGASSSWRCESGARVIGVNNRDLRTLEVDVERADRLRALVPDDRLVIAESGVRDAVDRRALAGARVRRRPRRRGADAGDRSGGGRRARSWRPAGQPETRPTSPADRSSRSAGSPTPRAWPRPSAPGRTRSG